MTRKHFKAIAQALARYRGKIQHGHTYGEAEDFSLLIDDLMAIFNETNPRFDKKRFWDATHQI